MWQKNNIIVVLLGVIIGLVLFVVSTCNDTPTPRSGKRTDSSVTRELPPSPSIIVEKGEPITIYITKKIPTYIIDSSALKNVIAQNDSLKNILRDSNVSITFATDTVHPVTHDTLRIICDELNRNIQYSLKYAPRMETTIFRTETMIQEVTFWQKIQYGLYGAAFTQILHLIFGK